MTRAGKRSRTRLRVVIATAVAVTTVAVPAAAAPASQVTDPVNDANGGGYWGSPDTPTPVGSQPYADVTSVLFTTTKAWKQVGGRRVAVVTGFTVAMRLAEPPVPPADTVAVYRVLASGPGCLFGIDHYTSPPGTQPQSAVQEWCRTPSIRRTAIAPPAISGNTITWTVPLSAVPKNAKVGVGTTLTDLHFEVHLRPRESACAGDAGTPAEEQAPCALKLDETFNRSGTYTIR